jgi:hypothetical protein
MMKPSGYPAHVEARALLLNTIRNKGDVPRECLIRACMADPWGFTRAQVLAAAKWWNIEEVERDGEVYWREPSSVIAIWWRRKIVAPGSLRIADRIGGAA